jgi:ABC-type multidrug transport system fused ATPase/permease subunit
VSAVSAFDGLKKQLRHFSARELLTFTRYLRKRPYSFAGGLACLFISSGMSLLFPLLLGSMLNVALHKGQILVPAIGAFSMDQIAICIGIAVILQAIFMAGGAYLFGRVSQMVLHDLRSDVYEKLIRAPMAFHAHRRVGELSSRLSADTAQIEGSLVMGLPQLCRQAVMLCGAVIMITRISGWLTAATVGILPVFVAITLLFSRKVRRIVRETQSRRAATATIVQETLQSVSSVKAFVNETLEIDRYQDSDNAARSSAVAATCWRAIFAASISLTLYGGISLVTWLGVRRLLAGQLTAGELTGFVIYSLYIAGAMSQVAQLFSQLQTAAAASHSLRKLLKQPIEDAAVSVGQEAPSAQLRGTVEFRGVSFHYPSRPEVQVLRDISFRVEAGEVIALLGRSGAGKSTLASLILRFFEPNEGQILIDGRPARDYSLKWLRQQMALVPQDILLYGGSIAENIRYGRPEASDIEVQAAARQANAEEFIGLQPDGFATTVGDRGHKLSGGQRQRIAIARAILKDPVILILDEATSSLDGETEAMVERAFESLMRNRTTFVIAHRLTTLRRANRIVVLEEGGVAAIGTHAELLAQPDGLYRRLCALQGLL